MIEVAARPCLPQSGYADGGFIILRPRWNVASKLCRRLGKGGLHDHAPGNRYSEAEQDRPNADHDFKSQGQGRCSA